MRVITNALSISILKLLMSRDMNLTDIADSLDTSKTTVQASLSRLELEKLIHSFRILKTAGSTMYCNTCIPLFVSGKNKGWRRSDYSDAVRNFYVDDARICSDSLLFYAYALNKHNICWHPFILGVGNLIGLTILPECPTEEDTRTQLSTLFGVELNDFKTEGSLSFRLVSENYTGIELLYVGYCILGAFLTILYRNTGWKYIRTAQVTRLSETEIVFTAEATSKTGILMENTDPKDRDFTYYSLRDRFAVYESKGKKSVLVKNEIILRIMECLSEGPKAVNEISSELELRVVTINASMKKMVELGFVEQAHGSTPRRIRYRIAAEKIVYGDQEDAKYIPGSVQFFIDKFVSGEVEFYNMVFDLNYFVLISAGIRYELLMQEIGRDVAKEVVLQNPEMTAQDFLNLAPKFYTRGQQSVRLSSIMPVEFDIEVPPEFDFELETSFFQTFVKTGLFEITGVDYPVWFRKVDRISDSDKPEE